MVKNGEQREFDSERLTDAGEELRAEQGVSPQQKEIVIRADPLYME